MEWSRAAYAAGTGAGTFFVIFVAWGIAQVVAQQAAADPVGEPPSARYGLITYLAVPAAMTLSAALLALVLGAGWWRSLLAALGSFLVASCVNLRGQGGYTPFDRREALAFVLFAALTVLFATIGRASDGRSSLIAAVVATSMALFALSVPPGWGFYVSLLAWVLMPAMAMLL